jgi:purine nucleosidase
MLGDSMRKFIIDTDTGSDDAIALIMALSDPNCEVCAITTVMGNVSVEQATRNAKIALEIAGKRDIPIYQGMHRPLVRSVLNATHVHGLDGLSQVEVDEPTLQTQEQHAIDALIEWADKLKNECEIIMLGPLTNLALAIRKAPDIMKHVNHVYIMGGAQLGYSGESEVAEFNILADPEAAHIVFRSGLNMTMVPLEVCLNGDGRDGAETVLSQDDVNRLIALNTKKAKFCVDCSIKLVDFHKQLLGDFGLELPDPTTVAVALHPELVLHRYRAQVDVDLSNSLSYGQTVVNTKGGTVLEHQVYLANMDIVTALDGKGFKNYLMECVK